MARHRAALDVTVLRKLPDYRSLSRYPVGVSLIADVSAAEAAVQDLIDLDVARHDPSVSPQLKRRLTLMRQRREQEVPGVRVSVAAKMLGLSERTTRDWLADGPLDPVSGAKPARVSTASLAVVLPAVEKLRELGQDRELLRALVDRLEDQRIRSHPRIRKSLKEMHRGEYEPFSSADL
jgi:DNA-binding transcriptional MerR regulator